MRFEDIWPIVVDGGKVTCDRLGAGVFVDYQFNGLRINHPHGASSGFRGTEEDREAEWREITEDDDRAAQARRDAAKPAPANVGTWKTGPAGNPKSGVIDPATAPIVDVEYGEGPKKALPAWPKPQAKKELPKWK